MIKIKFSILAVMLMTALFSFSSCSDDDDTYLPPNQAIINALNQLYPGVKNIEWEQKGVYYVADCWVGNDELDVWFDANANWIMVIEDLTNLTFPQKPEEFVFEVQQGGQERALYYSEYGGLLREKDISDTDNTHWPDI